MVTGDGGRVGGGVHFQKKLLNLISILQGELETGKEKLLNDNHVKLK